MHWILAVLEDLRSYAVNNGLSELASQLEQASRTAVEELLDPETEDAPPHGEGPAGREEQV